MNCISHGLRHCDSERMHKRDHSTLTSGSDRPAGPTRMATLQEISHCTVVGKSSKFIALSATQVVAPLFLHYTRCACQHRYRIGQVHRLPSGSDGVRVVRVAYLLTPVCARLHRQGRRPALCSLLHAVLPQVCTVVWQAYAQRTDRRQVERRQADLLQMDAVAYALADVDPCLSTAPIRRREGGSAWWEAATRAGTDRAYWSTAPSWRREGGPPRMEAAACSLLDADYALLSTHANI